MARLGDVAHLVGGGTPSKAEKRFWGGDVPWASVRDMKSRWLTETEFSITDEALKSSASNVVGAGNVVIATRVGLGKVVQVSRDTAINQDLRGVVPKDTSTLCPEYVYYWYQTVAHEVISAGTGATVQGVRIPTIAELLIPVPPLEEQKRIVAKLEELSSATTSGAANLQAQEREVAALGLAVSRSLFGTIHSQAPSIPLGEVASRVVVGFVGTTTPHYRDQGVPLIRTQNVTRTGIVAQDLKGSGQLTAQT